MYRIVLLHGMSAWLLAGLTFASLAGDPPRIDIAALEKKIHERVNEERVKHRLPVLEWDDRLAKVAREHSADMAQVQFFSHTNPKGEEAEQRATRLGLTPGKDFTAIAENIFQMDRIRSVRTFTYDNGRQSEEIKYRGPNEMAAVTVSGWMKSTGHRKNILTAELNRQGIGIAVSDEGLIYVTEVLIQSDAVSVSSSR